MERRNIREGGLPFAMQTASTATMQQQLEQRAGKNPKEGGDSDDDAEFFDCDDDKYDDEGKETFKINKLYLIMLNYGSLLKLLKLLAITILQTIFTPCY